MGGRPSIESGGGMADARRRRRRREFAVSFRRRSRSSDPHRQQLKKGQCTAAVVLPLNDLVKDNWVQLQLQNHPAKFWEDGIKDSITHAFEIMESYRLIFFEEAGCPSQRLALYVCCNVKFSGNLDVLLILLRIWCICLLNYSNARIYVQIFGILFCVYLKCILGLKVVKRRIYWC